MISDNDDLGLAAILKRCMDKDDLLRDEYDRILIDIQMLDMQPREARYTDEEWTYIQREKLIMYLQDLQRICGDYKKNWRDCSEAIDLQISSLQTTIDQLFQAQKDAK